MFKKIFQHLFLSPAEQRYDDAYTQALHLLRDAGYTVTMTNIEYPDGQVTKHLSADKDES